MGAIRKRALKCPRCGSKKIAVTQLKCNHSAFNGYRETPSDRSSVKCQEKHCGNSWRTYSDEVYKLPEHKWK